MHTIKICLISGLLMFLFTACKEDQIGPMDENDDTPPSPVTNASVENMPGAAQISYELPDDSDLQYVKAVYQINDGTTRETKSSQYNNSLNVVGFGDSQQYNVELYAVDRSENESEPVTVTVEPLTPPVVSVSQSLNVQEDFGGIHVAFNNENEGDIVIFVITKEDNGDWISAGDLYTSQIEGDFNIRGYEAEPRTFGVYVRDRWENYSDTLMVEAVPLFEEELDKTQFKTVHLPGDTEPYSSAWIMSNLWDNSYSSTGWHSTTNIEEGAVLPMTITMDMGVKAKLSRMKTWQRFGGGNGFLYEHHNLKHAEIWGSNDPAQDGSFDGWTKLTEFESVKPSGSPLGEITNEDVEYASAGEDATFPIDAPPVRYIRFKIIETWSSAPGTIGGYTNIMEMTFWGDIQ